VKNVDGPQRLPSVTESIATQLFVELPGNADRVFKCWWKLR
jgi:hypothetical protein